MGQEVIFYRADSGRSPVEEFLDTPSFKQAKKAAWVMGRLEDLENVQGNYFRRKRK